MTSPNQEHRDAAAYQFAAALGGATAAANYPVTMVGETMAATSRAYGLENQILALPNYVQVRQPGLRSALRPILSARQVGGCGHRRALSIPTKA